MAEDDGAWFRPKKLGYGAGWPIAWQGWAALAAYILIAMFAAFMWRSQDEVYAPVGVMLFIGATIGFVVLARARTRGGWRWGP